MTAPEQNAITECFRLIAAAFDTSPESLTRIVSMIVKEDRADYLNAAHTAGFLLGDARQQLGLAVVPMLESSNPEAVTIALRWIHDAGCDNPELLTRALMTARNHYKELIQLGANPNLIPQRFDYTPIGVRVRADDLAGFAQMIDAMPPAIPLVSRGANLFDLAIEDMTLARAEMVDYVLDRLPDDMASARAALATAVVRLAVRRRHGSAAKEYPRATFPTVLRMIQRAGRLTNYHATAWHALFNSDYFSVERTSFETQHGDGADTKFLRNVLDLAHHDQAVELLRKAASEGFSINHPCIQTNGRSYPALHYAVSRGHITLVERLLDAGANPYAPDSRGSTSLQVATQFGHTEIATLLSQRTPA